MSDAPGGGQPRANGGDDRASAPVKGSKRGISEPDAPRKSPRNAAFSSNAGPGAGSAITTAIEAPPPDLLFPINYSAGGDGESVNPGAGVAPEPEGLTVSNAVLPFGTPLSFEDASPAQYAVMSLLSAHPGPLTGGSSYLQQLQHDMRVKASNISDELADYARALSQSGRLDVEECFEMLLLLIKSRGMGTNWEHAWPIDVYLRCGVSFGGSWHLDNYQVKTGKWRNRARELEVAQTPREHLETFALLFQDAAELGENYYLHNLPPYFNSITPGGPDPAAAFLLRLKKRVWTELCRDRDAAWQKMSSDLQRKFGEDSDPQIFTDLTTAMQADARDGTRRPPKPTELGFRIAWKHMNKRFAAENPTPEAQLQYDGVVVYVEELFQRFGRMQLPLTNDSITMSAADGSGCLKFCENMWDALDQDIAFATGALNEEWRKVIADTSDEKDRRALQLRFAAMHRHQKAGWAYGVKSQALPRATLWQNIKIRLTALGLSERGSLELTRLYETSQSLAGNGILVEPPLLPHGVDPDDYVFNDLKPAFLPHEMAYWGPIWDRSFLRDSSAHMQRTMVAASKARIWAEAKTTKQHIYSPIEEDWRQQWALFHQIIVVPEPATVLAGRFRDLREAVETFSYLFGDFVLPRSQFDPTKSAHELVGRLSSDVRQVLWQRGVQACNLFRDVAIGQSERAFYDGWVAILGTNMNEGGPCFRPWDPPPNILADRNPETRGSGVDRGGVRGTWEFEGHVGQGTYGNVSCWKQVDKGRNLVNRIVMKEAYYPRLWDLESWWIGDRNLRRPKEFFYPHYLTSLPQSSCIVRPTAYGIYENAKMYRIYMEYCRHEDLRKVLRRYRYPEAIEANARVPTRMVWAVFESLVSALCLMRDGCLPGGVRPLSATGETFERIMHMDLKDNNIFLADASPSEWPGIPTAKIGDWGLVTMESSERSRGFYGGTATFKAPEQFDYVREEVISRFPRQPTSTASDLWAVGRIVLSLMNSEPVYDGYTYAEGQTLPTFTNGAEEFHPKALCDLVVACLKELPGDRPLCTEVWKEICTNVATAGGGPPLKFSPANVEDNEVFYHENELPLMFTLPASSP